MGVEGGLDHLYPGMLVTGSVSSQRIVAELDCFTA
ncbi:uncharacterized protein METZ01_LOCUS142397, partial [marine metagenome]